MNWIMYYIFKKQILKFFFIDTYKWHARSTNRDYDSISQMLNSLKTTVVIFVKWNVDLSE